MRFLIKYQIFGPLGIIAPQDDRKQNGVASTISKTRSAFTGNSGNHFLSYKFNISNNRIRISAVLSVSSHEQQKEA